MVNTMDKIIVISVFVIILVMFFYNTSILQASLFNQYKSQYKPYFYDNFTEYSNYSLLLNSSPANLSKWGNNGSITAFTYVDNWYNISKVNLVLTDSNNKSVTLNGIINLKYPRQDNLIHSGNDPFPTYTFTDCPNQTDNVWAGYMIVNGSNLLFWQFNKSLGLDMNSIVSWKAYNGNQTVNLSDVVIQNGLCHYNNGLGSKWYPPIGLPEYGVFWTNSSGLVLRRVTSAQYPTNGNHVRVLSQVKTPKNFLMQINFTVVNVSSNASDLYNTYIRLGWDFENVYGPGHNETILYDSYQYGWLGLQRVYPIKRYVLQGSEPNKTDPTYNQSRVKFTFQKGHTYNVDIKVENKTAQVQVWDVGRFWETKVASLNYNFTLNRPYNRYPFSIETTGNVSIVVHSFDVLNQTNVTHS